MSTISERVAQRSLEAEAEEEEEEDVGELEIAEYVIFLLALDTYSRYIEEATDEETSDDLVRKGIQLVKMADRRYAESVQGFLTENVSTPAQKKLVTKAFKRLPNPSGLARRTLDIRTALSKGGPGAMRAVFKTNKALRGVRAAIEASTMEDADAALDKLAVIPMRNQRIRKWIDDAAENAGSGTYQDPIVAGAGEVVDSVEQVLSSRVQEEGTASGVVEEQDAPKEDHIAQVQQAATEIAQKAMQVSGEPDEPPTKSEVVGIAAAAAVSATTDPGNPNNIPVPLQKLDDEQRAAALTDGRVLVAAGAGAGKSTTVVSRVEYLIKNRRVNPSRCLVTSFNTKAAAELKQKIGTAIGGDSLKQMSVGTMHSLFRKFIGEYGTAQERSAMGLGKNRGGFVQGGGAVARAVQRIWEDCYGGEDAERKPKLKTVMMDKSRWSGNNVTPAEAKENAESRDEEMSAEWYEMYEGLKGSIPGWRPPCKSKAYESFMGRWRPNDERLGDFDDMLGIFDTILKREPAVRKTMQSMFDHIIVDEAQDLSGVQFSIVSQMSEHVSDGKDSKSLWICGDDKQSIYGFRGARPDLFTQLNTTEGWKTQVIRTNYRCQPEIVEAANALISNNQDQIPMEAAPAPHKVRGTASIRVETAEDEAVAALNAIEEIKVNIAAGAEVSDHAILTRTNKEQHAFETACIIRGVPYARKGASSFLGSPETKAFLSYVQLVTGSDTEKMQKALGEIINKPNRFFVAPEAASNAVSEALSQHARAIGQSLKTVNPVEALGDYEFRRGLARRLARSDRGFKFEKTMEKLYEIYGDISDMQASSTDPDFTTSDLFDGILGMSGTMAITNPTTGKAEYVETTFRDSLKADMRNSMSEDDDTEEEEEGSEHEGLGNISFLYELAKADPTDEGDLLNDPGTPFGFKSKMERYAERARELRIDITKWDKEQAALPPEQRKAPPGVYVGTIHSVKGAQWPNCYVSMPKGKFPYEPPTKPGEPPKEPDPNSDEVQSERRLAYVALTRAAQNLTVLCPSVVGGKAAGISPFVDEARLNVGENVAKPGALTVDDEDRMKTANNPEIEYEGVTPDDWNENWSSEYDRRQS